MKQIEIIVTMIQEEKIQMLPVLGFQSPNISSIKHNQLFGIKVHTVRVTHTQGTGCFSKFLPVEPSFFSVLLLTLSNNTAPVERLVIKS